LQSINADDVSATAGATGHDAALAVRVNTENLDAADALADSDHSGVLGFESAAAWPERLDRRCYFYV
jgi:hypothetical protein